MKKSSKNRHEVLQPIGGFGQDFTRIKKKTEFMHQTSTYLEHGFDDHDDYLRTVKQFYQ